MQFCGPFFTDAQSGAGAGASVAPNIMLRLGGRSAPVSPFSLHGPIDVVQPAPCFGTNSFSSADSPLSRWFSDQLAEVAASTRLDQHAPPPPPQQQQPLQPLPRSLSSKAFSARYGRWADGVIEDMMTTPGSLADRSDSSSLRCAAFLELHGCPVPRLLRERCAIRKWYRPLCNLTASAMKWFLITQVGVWRRGRLACAFARRQLHAACAHHQPCRAGNRQQCIHRSRRTGSLCASAAAEPAAHAAQARSADAWQPVERIQRLRDVLRSVGNHRQEAESAARLLRRGIARAAERLQTDGPDVTEAQ